MAKLPRPNFRRRRDPADVLLIGRLSVTMEGLKGRDLLDCACGRRHFAYAEGPGPPPKRDADKMWSAPS